jgi:DNA-binding ferritin-like protein
MRERLGNIEQIRDILFGPQIREYSSRLDKLESDLSTLRHETRDRIEQLKTSLVAEVRQAITTLDKKVKLVHASAQEETAELRQYGDRLNQKISQGIRQLDESLDKQTSAIRQDLTQAQDKLQHDLSSLQDLVLQSLEKRFSSLDVQKASKEDIAEALFELGMRLKGTDVIPQLRAFSENENFSDPITDLNLVQGLSNSPTRNIINQSV